MFSVGVRRGFGWGLRTWILGGCYFTSSLLYMFQFSIHSTSISSVLLLCYFAYIKVFQLLFQHLYMIFSSCCFSYFLDIIDLPPALEFCPEQISSSHHIHTVSQQSVIASARLFGQTIILFLLDFGHRLWLVYILLAIVYALFWT